MMREASFVLFVVSLALFVVTLLSGMLMLGEASAAPAAGTPIVITSALSSAAMPFAGAAILYRIDRWLERAR
jgi:Na+/H+-dicarboxylate symporter